MDANGDGTGVVGQDETDQLHSLEHVLGSAQNDKLTLRGDDFNPTARAESPITLEGGAGTDQYHINEGDIETHHVLIRDTGVTDELYVDGVRLSGTITVPEEADAHLNGYMINGGPSSETFGIWLGSTLIVLENWYNGAYGITWPGLPAGEPAMTLSGSAADDTLTGGTNNDTLTVSGGNDIASAGAGRDVIHVQGGNHTIDGGADNDTVTYAALAAHSSITLTLDSGGNGSAQVGTAFTNSLTGIEHIIGSGQNDSLRVLAAGFTLDGGVGDDTLEGGADGDELSGGTGFDWLSYKHAAEGVRVETYGWDSIGGASGVGMKLSSEWGGDSFEGIEGIQGSEFGDRIDLSSITSGLLVDGDAGNDSIYGANGHDTLGGGSGNDSINGGAGNDYIEGGLGADVLKGESGADIYRIGDKTHSTASGTDIILGFSQGGGDKIDLSGLGFSDIHNGQSSAEGTALAYWHQFGDTFVGNADGSFRLRIDGEFALTRGDFIGVGPDYAFTHVGTTGNDSLVGGTGDDVFDGGKGQDVMRGKGGSDIYFYDHLEDSKDSSPDTILEWDNSDVIDVSYLGFTGIQVGSANGSTLGWAVSGSYTEIFDSGKFLIRIHNDTASGTPNLTADNFIFSDGPGFTDESYSGTGGADTYVTGLGNDVLNGNDGDDVLTGGGGHDTLDGGAGNDTLYGGDGGDTLFGQGGYDRLEAGGGHDRLIAGVNKDWLVGGSGNDTFSFFSDSHSSDVQPDTIADFVQGDDVIDLATLTYTGIQSGAASGTVLGYTHQQNASSQNITVIEADTGAFEIIVMGHVNLVTGDFVF